MNGENEPYLYVQHMQSEHLKVDQLIRRTLAAVPTWEEPDAADWLPRMRNGLVQIHTELAHHFREEEQGACLEEAVARRPQLSSEVQRIGKQHDELLARLSELIDRCQCCSKLTAQQSKAIEQELREVVRDLRAHEALENKIMQEGFGVCLKSEDASPKADFSRLNTAHPQGAAAPHVRPAAVGGQDRGLEQA